MLPIVAGSIKTLAIVFGALALILSLVDTGHAARFAGSDLSQLSPL